MIPVFPEAGIEVADLACAVAEQTGAGARFAGLFAAGCPDGSILISAVLAWPGRLGVLEVSLAPGELAYPALTPKVPGATWYERELHDLFGLEPLGHPRLDALVLPLQNGALRPMPGMKDGPARLEAGEEPLPFHVIGEGLFTIPYGPVRSGVFESVQYLVETPGEEIPHLRTRVYHKHRGLARRFEAMSIDDGVLLAERVEGTTSVAQAWAFSQAVESIGASEVPPRASLLRLVHAELERLANHLDSMIRHCEGSGQAVAYARLSLHKERVLRLQARLCGHRFGRGVVVPGGVAGAPLLGVKAALSEVLTLQRGLRGDLTLLMETPSFLDRLRTAGRLASDVARAHGALGPIGRASGLAEDARQSRPYGPYDLLGFEPAAVRSAG
ncbi:MAG: NADH-quinone oxidoreductase subunit C, partial [Acidimicrobiales bacterium]